MLRAFEIIGKNILNEILEDIDFEVELVYDLINTTQQSNETCFLLGDPEETRLCLKELRELYSLQENGILARIVELAKLGTAALTKSERNLQEFISGNRIFVIRSSQVTREDLTSCVQNL
jgi:hypothetical protein